MDNNVCTIYEAAALWELNRSGTEDFSGLILALDLDRGGAGLCRCQPGEMPVQIWETPGRITASFFRDAATELIPGCEDPEQTARMLYDAVSEPDWVSMQKNYLRSGRTVDMSLPSFVSGGQVYSVNCSGIDTIFSRTWREHLSQMLAEARSQLQSLGAEETCRILPVGQLARLFLAEYLIREAFMAMPMLPDPRLRTCTAKEDPARIAEMGAALYQEAISKPQTLNCTLRLQVFSRSDNNISMELLTLANSGVTMEELKTIRYVGPVCVSRRSGLTVFADSQMHSIPLPETLFRQEESFVCIEVGVGSDGDKLVLGLRRDDGAVASLALDMI